MVLSKIKGTKWWVDVNLILQQKSYILATLPKQPCRLPVRYTFVLPINVQQ